MRRHRGARKSGRITLTLMSALALAGCDAGSDLARNAYSSKEDCVADYSEAQCQPTHVSGSGGSGFTRWYGPTYDRNDPVVRPDNPGAGRENRAMFREPVRRGGFGSIGRSLFSGS